MANAATVSLMEGGAPVNDPKWIRSAFPSLCIVDEDVLVAGPFIDQTLIRASYIWAATFDLLSGL